jgi:hypothetical protein
MQGEMRHAAQFNAGLLNRAVITRNEREAALQFARDLLYDPTRNRLLANHSMAGSFVRNKPENSLKRAR